MKYFLDTEFIEDGKTIDLISLAIVAEDSRSIYVQNTECVFEKASDWVWRNVFPFLTHFSMKGKRDCNPVILSRDSGLYKEQTSKCSDLTCPWYSRKEIKDKILEFCCVEKYGKPEFWGYYADYDWVVFCQLFGSMIELPKGFPMYCNDIKQFCKSIGDPKLPSSKEHNALSDALHNKEIYEFLLNLNK